MANDIFFVPGIGAEYCDEHIFRCLSVCLLAYLRNCIPIFTNFLSYYGGMLCTSCFMDDAMFEQIG